MNSANEGTNSFPNEDAAAHGAAAFFQLAKKSPLGAKCFFMYA